MQPHGQPSHDDVRFHRVDDRITVALAPVEGERVLANATIVVGDRATAVIDAMLTPAQTEPVRAEAERLAGGRRVRYVALTHADPDHVLGLPSFAGATVVASARAAAVLRDPEVGRFYAAIAARNGGDPAAFEMPAVDVAFDERATIDLGGATLAATDVGPAHSPADTLWWCPEARVAWSGDLVFHGLFPLVRTEVRRWLAGLDRLTAFGPVVVVPGHGVVAGPDVLGDQRRVLTALMEAVAPLHAAGVPVADAVAQAARGSLGALPLVEERWAGAVAGVYAELDRSDR
jgi:cyclase